MKLLKDLRRRHLEHEIRTIKNVKCHWTDENQTFLMVEPKQEKKMRLKEEYKIADNSRGRITEYQAAQQQHELIQKADAKLRVNGFKREAYDHPDAALKLHLSLNNMRELDQSIVFGLVDLLIKESESEDNNMSFRFKIVAPEWLNDVRFKNTDQFTVYFDKYSPVADVLRLVDKVNTYLKSNIPENQIKRGPKDSFGFNSFVSARFDTNNLLHLYDIYRFFDLELKKFFEKHHAETELESLPIGAFDAVFDKILTSDQITQLKSEDSEGLGEASSVIVQAEFDQLIKDPKQYIRSPERDQLDLFENKINNLEFDFSQDSTVADISGQLQNKKSELHAIAKALDEFKEPSRFQFSIDKIKRMIAKKEQLIETNARARCEELFYQRVNPQTVEQFTDLLDDIKEKAKDLTNDGYKKKGIKASQLHNEINEEFVSYKLGNQTFDQFKDNCHVHIEKARSILAEHMGWKEVFVNLLKTIGSLGIVPLYNYKTSNKQYFFTPVNTDSINKVEKLEDAIDELRENSTLEPV